MPGHKILVVEDDPDVRESLSELLRLWGHDVLQAMDGETALTIAEAASPDVALLDLGLPGMDGYEVAGRLRGAPSGDRLFLVALTGYGRAEDIDRIRESGFDAHLLKGSDPDKLEQLLATIPQPARA